MAFRFRFRHQRGCCPHGATGTGCGQCRHKTLCDLAPGDEGIISDVACSRKTRRLLELGLLPGEKVTVERFGPMGDPIEIKFRGYHLSLRRVLAQCISIL